MNIHLIINYELKRRKGDFAMFWCGFFIIQVTVILKDAIARQLDFFLLVLEDFTLHPEGLILAEALWIEGETLSRAKKIN